jgi:hypothetical protein
MKLPKLLFNWPPLQCKKPPAIAEGFIKGKMRERLLFRNHFMLSSWQLLEGWQRAQPRSFWLAGAAAGNGKKRKDGSARRKKKSNHGL